MILLLALLILTATSIVDVHDGDTVTVILNGERQRVRLHGIDAPELSQPGGRESRDYLRSLLAHPPALDTHGEDRYGRTLAVLIVDGRDVNEEMVRAGHAWWFRRYAPSDERLQKAEHQARAAHRGLWAYPHPEAPWDYRRRRRP